MHVDAIVVGSGPNGLVAGIELIKAGQRVCVYEASDHIGGGARSAELTTPGFLHDICSAVHPLAVSSPVFQQLPLAHHGLQFIEPPAAVAHPFDDGTAILLQRSIAETSSRMASDASNYQRLMHPLVANWQKLSQDLLRPVRFPRHPFHLVRFGLKAIRSAEGFIKACFREDHTQAFFAALAAHSSLPLDQLGTNAFALVLGILGHAVGWPIPHGGSQSISNALASYFRESGGQIVTGVQVRSLQDLPPARCIFFDVTPRQLLKIMQTDLPRSYAAKLERYRYGPGAFKMDWALDEPVPWKASECKQAATVHLGGTFREILASERAAWEGRVCQTPFVILSQPTLFDSTRAPAGKHTLWGYCHVPNGSNIDMSEFVENQIERFAPGFRKLIIARHVMPPRELERHNPNLVGGDINGGAQIIQQMFTRPTLRMYSTPRKGIYLCSSSTPPGGGVHGLCGYYAARVALRKSV
jgi:phytoene dehydrogenase-like protein